MIIDSHAHLSSDDLLEDVDLVVQRATDAGIHAIINICTDEKSLREGIKLHEKYPQIYNVGATTPHDVAQLGEKEFPLFEKAARDKKLVAIGETGLDYHYEHSPKALQQEFLRRYFLLAKELSLPVVIHCRDAFSDLFEIADEVNQGSRVLLHCFTGDEPVAKKAIERGWKISISGIVTFKRSQALRDVVKIIPPEFLFIETDAPYLAPQSMRGKRCEPAMIKETLECVAQLKNKSVETMAEMTSRNCSEFFGL